MTTTSFQEIFIYKKRIPFKKIKVCLGKIRFILYPPLYEDLYF